MSDWCFKYSNMQLVDIMIHHYVNNKDVLKELKETIKSDILKQDKYHEEVHQELLSLFIDVKNGKNQEAFKILKRRCDDLSINLDDFLNR